MPVNFGVGYEESGTVAIYRYFGFLAASDVLDAFKKVTEFLNSVEPGIPHRVLVIFDGDVDLSELTATEMNALRSAAREDNEGRRSGPRKAAAALTGKVDTQIMVRLWNTLCGLDNDTEFALEPFTSIEYALRWLGISPVTGRAVMSKMK